MVEGEMKKIEGVELNLAPCVSHDYFFTSFDQRVRRRRESGVEKYFSMKRREGGLQLVCLRVMRYFTSTTFLVLALTAARCRYRVFTKRFPPHCQFTHFKQNVLRDMTLHSL
jgi:hypothetical protein